MTQTKYWNQVSTPDPTLSVKLTKVNRNRKRQKYRRDPDCYASVLDNEHQSVLGNPYGRFLPYETGRPAVPGANLQPAVARVHNIEFHSRADIGDQR